MNTDRIHLWKRLLLGSAAMLMLANAPLQAAPKKVAAVEGITEYQYDNGLRLLLFPDNSKPTVTVNITYFVGSRHEGRGETGMAHLLEHMVFKGTPTHKDIWKLLEDHGARFNGTTWTDRTNYYETLPSDEANLEFALKMEADRMINSLIDQEELAKEMTVVRNEFEMGENYPVGILEERMVSSAYLWHNYGKSTIGNRTDIERVPADNLRVFYQKYYQPDNAMLVIAGDFKTEKALELVDKYYASIPKPERKLDDTYTVEPTQDGARHVELRRNGDVAACGTVYHISPGSHPDYAATDVISDILTNQPSGRLYQALVESGIATSVNTSAYGYKEPGVMVTLAEVRTENPVEPVLQKMIEVIESLSANPITDEEVKRSKTKLLKNIELAMKDSARIGIQLTEWAASGDWRLFFLHRDRLEKLDVETVRQVASTYFKPANRTSGVFYPTKDIDRTVVPETPDVLAMVKDYKGKEALAEGEDFDATPENIEKRVVRSQLSNGMKLALLSKETRGDAVSATLVLHFAGEADLKGKQTAIGMIPSMLMRGSKNYSYQQIKDKLDELKANVSMAAGGGFGGADGSMTVRIRTDRAHLQDVLTFVTEILRNPTFPESEFDILKKEQLAGVESQLSEPQALAFNSLFRRLSPWQPDDVRYIPTLEEQIERTKTVELNTLKQFYTDFYGASFGQMSVVGDFDPKEIQALVEKRLGNWTSAKKFARIESPFRSDIQTSDATIITPDKQMAMIGFALNMELRDDEPEYPGLHLADYILGASAKSRLLNRLRQKEGLSYGAGSFLMADSEDRNGFWAGMAICAPQNVDKAYASLLDELNTMIQKGVDQAELADAQASYAQQIKTQFTNDSAVAAMLAEGLYLNRTMAYYQNLHSQVAQLKPEQVNQAIQKLVDTNRLITVKAGDLKSAEETPKTEPANPG